MGKERGLNVIFSFLLAATGTVVPVIAHAAYEPINGKVVDKKTGQPLEGVIYIRDADGLIVDIVYAKDGGFSGFADKSNGLTIDFIPSNQIVGLQCQPSSTTISPDTQKVEIQATCDTEFRANLPDIKN
jgi:hypothetical protein